MKKTTWEKEEIITLVFLRSQDISYEHIAKYLDRTVSSCQTEMHNVRCGLDIVSRAIDEQGFGNVKLQIHKEESW